ncbi:hypothetical protein [Mycobacterium sp. E2497]
MDTFVVRTLVIPALVITPPVADTAATIPARAPRRVDSSRARVTRKMV